MTIKVLLADDSEIMRPAIARLLKEEPSVELVGEATSFGETIKLAAALKPDILLMDLHMHDECEYPPQLVKSQLFQNIENILAISVWNDRDAKDLADRFGAKALLDKTTLVADLIPAIKLFSGEESKSSSAAATAKASVTSIKNRRDRHKLN